MSEQSPFDPQIISHLFETRPSSPERAVRRESSSLEFKENFNQRSSDQYARTMAAFANTIGGYIVFGIKNSPRILSGLSKPKRFEEFDPHRMAEFLNEYFSPEIKWAIRSENINGKLFGLIYVYEADTKPIMCTKNSDKLAEGFIYYRYHGRTQRVRYPELRKILEEEIGKKQNLLLKQLHRISRLGVENVAILDTLTGRVDGTGGPFLIDEDLLDKIKFIRQGKFDETSGEPTIKIVGDAVTLPESRINPVQPTAISTTELFRVFLQQEDVGNPAEYFRASCHAPSGYLPVYYFLGRAGLSRTEATEIMNAEKSRTNAKRTLKQRLSAKREDFSIALPARETEASLLKQKFANAIRSDNVPANLSEHDLKYLLQAVCLLSESEIKIEYLFPLLWGIFIDHYDRADSTFRDYFRKAICHLDTVLYQEALPLGD